MISITWIICATILVTQGCKDLDLVGPLIVAGIFDVILVNIFFG